MVATKVQNAFNDPPSFICYEKFNLEQADGKGVSLFPVSRKSDFFACKALFLLGSGFFGSL